MLNQEGLRKGHTAMKFNFLAVLAVCCSGCYSVDYPESFPCSAASPQCPEGQTCNGARCVAHGGQQDLGTGDLSEGDQPVTPSVCGDHEITGKEVCDGALLGNNRCETHGFDGGELRCAEDCRSFDTSGCTKCGDQRKNNDEQCDGMDLGEATCKTQGFSGGKLGCTDGCTFDTTECQNGAVCDHDNRRDPGEQCDGGDFGGDNCATYGYFGGGFLKCNSCNVDTSQCIGTSTCNYNGQRDPGEQCDGSDFGGDNCTTYSYFGGGFLQCNDCNVDTSQCILAGVCDNDNVSEPGEQCDGDDFGGMSCETYGYLGGGFLKCNGDCTVDFSQCQNGGSPCDNNGVRGSDEYCDGDDFGGDDCGTYGYPAGWLRCTPMCTVDLSQCLNVINCNNNGVKDPLEECDGDQFGTKTCQSFNYGNGTLTCTNQCTIDTSQCYGTSTCNHNGVIDQGEECDGSALPSNRTCQTEGQWDGQLLCTDDCTINSRGCAPGVYRYIASGEFWMGADPNSVCVGSNEDLHHVKLSRDFEIAETETTQGQFMTLLGFNPSEFLSGACQRPDCPVEQVRWDEAAAYCNKVSAIMGYTPCYTCTMSNGLWFCLEDQSTILGCDGYRLPTDAEWEFAYRAGSTTNLYQGNLSVCQGWDNALDQLGWYNANTGSTQPVAMKIPNNLGLFDMAGNVMEWVQDWYQPNLGSFDQEDPLGPLTGLDRVVRGGSWFSEGQELRASARSGYSPGTISNNVGFRCLRVPNP